jgi:hypothetical protein
MLYSLTAYRNGVCRYTECCGVLQRPSNERNEKFKGKISKDLSKGPS